MATKEKKKVKTENGVKSGTSASSGSGQKNKNNNAGNEESLTLSDKHTEKANTESRKSRSGSGNRRGNEHPETPDENVSQAEENKAWRQGVEMYNAAKDHGDSSMQEYERRNGDSENPDWRYDRADENQQRRRRSVSYADPDFGARVHDRYDGFEEGSRGRNLDPPQYYGQRPRRGYEEGNNYGYDDRDLRHSPAYGYRRRSAIMREYDYYGRSHHGNHDVGSGPGYSSYDDRERGSRGEGYGRYDVPQNSRYAEDRGYEREYNDRSYHPDEEMKFRRGRGYQANQGRVGTGYADYSGGPRNKSAYGRDWQRDERYGDERDDRFMEDDFFNERYDPYAREEFENYGEQEYRNKGYQSSGEREGFGYRNGRRNNQDREPDDEYRGGHALRRRGSGKHGSR